MTNHENLAKQNNQQPTVGISIKQKLTIVSGMSDRDVETAEKAVHLGHIGQMPKFQIIAAENLRVHTGLPVDVFVTSNVIDLRAWRERRKVGEYYKSPDGGTFTYTEIIEERGSERVSAIGGDPVSMETVAFTNRSRAEVISSLGDPVKPSEDNLIMFPQRKELRPTG